MSFSRCSRLTRVFGYLEYKPLFQALRTFAEITVYLVTIVFMYALLISIILLGAYARQDVAAQMSLRNWCLSSATLLADVIVPNVSVISFSHLCLGLPRLLFPATIPCIIVFSKPLWRVTWPTYFSFWRLTKLYSQLVGRWSSFHIEQLVRWAIQGIRNILR